MKTVEYLGSVYEVPDFANFIAADADGSVYAFSVEPEWNTDWKQYGGDPLIGTQSVYVGELVDQQPPLKAI